MHDAFVKIHGKGSHYYMTNNETIKNSLFSLIPTEDMIDYFLYPKKLRRLHHGVDTNYFFPHENKKDIRLICVGGGDDRKGFHLAVQAAQKLGLPITIVGPDSIHEDYNKKFIRNAPNDLIKEQKNRFEEVSRKLNLLSIQTKEIQKLL